MPTSDPAFQLLCSREKRDFISSFHSDISEFIPDKETREWHRLRGETHSIREVLLVLSGSVTQQINGKFYQCDAPSVVLFNHNEIHTLGYDKNCSGLHCWLTILPQDLRWVFMYGTEKYHAFSMHGFIKLQHETDKLKKLWNEAARPDIQDYRKNALVAEISGCLAQIFAEVYLQAGTSHHQYQSRTQNITETIKMIKDHLQEHCDCSIREAASLTGYSPTHFIRLFKQYTGTGFKEYLNTVRQEKYFKLYSSMPAKQLAAELGFSSSAALAHWHKKNFNPPNSKPAEKKTDHPRG